MKNPNAAGSLHPVLRRFRRLIPRRYRNLEWTLKPQTHQGANDSRSPTFNIWVRGSEWTEATFLLGDLCTWNFKRDGWRLMAWSPKQMRGAAKTMNINSASA